MMLSARSRGTRRCKVAVEPRVFYFFL